MTITFITGNSTTPLAPTTGSSIYVAPGATLLDDGSGFTGGAVISVADGQFAVNILIDGTVDNFTATNAVITGIFLGSSSGLVTGTGGSLVSIGATGILRSSFSAIDMQSTQNTVENAGLIAAKFVGILSDGATNRVLNSGVIQGDAGLNMRGASNSVTNSGEILGRGVGVSFTKTGARLDNSGLIQGQTAASLAESGGKVENSGTINVELLGLTLDGGTGTVANSGAIQATTSTLVMIGDVYSVLNQGEIRGGALGLKASGNDITIRSTGSIAAMEATGIAVDATGFRFALVNGGDLSGGLAAIRYVSSSLNGGTLRIENQTSGQISGLVDGIVIDYADDAVGGEFARIVNAGAISGSEAGIRIKGLPATLLNQGTINAQNGPAVLSDSEQNVRLVNSGTIASLLPVNSGAVTAIDLKGVFGGGAHELRNLGQILGDVQMGDQLDQVRNRGLIEGELRLDLGNDLYNGRGGQVTGQVLGEEGNDRMTAGDAADDFHGGQGADQLSGGGGDDQLRGATGSDTLTGRAGGDVFVFANAAEAGKGANADHISDFQTGQDLISLRFVTGGSYIGAGPFTNVAGQVRYQQASGTVQGDVNGDGVADFTLVLDNRTALTAADFLFQA